MLIEWQYRPWLACGGADETRPVFTHVIVERLEKPLVEERRQYEGIAVAADGYVLAAVPVQLDPEEAPCLVPIKAFEEASIVDGCRWIGLGRAEHQTVRTDKATFPKCPPDVTIPDWRSLVPHQRGAMTSFGLNDLLLAKVARALGIKGTGLRLTMGARPGDPLVVQPLRSPWEVPPRPPFGLVMTMYAPDMLQRAGWMPAVTLHG